MQSKAKTALITGASAGFGQATAKLLAQHGYKLVLIARRSDRLEDLQKSLDVPVHIARLDIRERGKVEKFFSQLPEEFSDIDILINNAGLALGLESAHEIGLDDWDEMVDTNIKGLLYMSRCVLEIMVQRGQGLIINIGSVAGRAPYKGGNVYGATKAFVAQFSRNLRTDLFGTNIKVTNIEPGAAETEFSKVRFKGDEEKAKQVYANMRPLKAEDIAETVWWVIQRPPHVNIDTIEVMPLDQTWGGLVTHRQ